LTFKRLVNTKARCSESKGYGHYDYQCPSKSQHVSIVSSDDVDDSKVIEDVHVLSKTTSIIEDISVSSDTLILDEGHAPYEGTTEIVNAIVESGTPLIVELMFMILVILSSVSSKFLGIYFATFLIEDEIDHETIDSSVVTSSESSESPPVDYDFMVVPTKSSSNESSKFLVMIQ